MNNAPLACLLWVGLAGAAFGQNLNVQQPIVGRTSVSTAAMVPDRGRVFLGGVSSAQSSQSRYGFGTSGSAIGLTRASSSLSAGVRITDLREMDEAILNSVPDRHDSAPEFARHAAAISTPRAETPRKEEFTAERAAKFERLARKAESENRPGVAKLHWQMAAKYGSTIARDHLVVSSR